MKVTLIGASGFVGKAVLNELLNRGHQVQAMTQKSRVDARPGLTVLQTDATRIDELAEAVRDTDAVISAFNAGWSNPNLYNDFLNGSKAIQEGVRKSGVKRLLVVGGAGSLYVDGKQLVNSPQFPEPWKAGALAARDYLNELKSETDLDWVFLSPAVEMHPGTSGVRRGGYRTGSDSPVFDNNGKSVISVEDVAVAIVDELEHPQHSRQRFTVAY